METNQVLNTICDRSPFTNDTDVQEYEHLKKRIAEMAVSIAPDYPRVQEIGTMEQLWAIESTHLGIKAANIDWQKFGKAIVDTYNIPFADIAKLFNQVQNVE